MTFGWREYIGDRGIANTSTIAMAPLYRGWTLYAHTPPSGTAISSDDDAVVGVWESLGTLHDYQISHGDLRHEETPGGGATFTVSVPLSRSR